MNGYIMGAITACLVCQSFASTRWSGKVVLYCMYNQHSRKHTVIMIIGKQIECAKQVWNGTDWATTTRTNKSPSQRTNEEHPEDENQRKCSSIIQTMAGARTGLVGLVVVVAVLLLLPLYARLAWPGRSSCSSCELGCNKTVPLYFTHVDALLKANKSNRTL